MGIQADLWIAEQAVAGMIEPFCPQLFRKSPHTGLSVISYGLSSYGYDLRLSPQDFRVFRHVPGKVVNPKCFDARFLEPARLETDDYGSYFVLPGHSYGLGVSFERLKIPRDVTVQCIGKSTYARCGIIANLTPIEAGWEGYLTLEFSNSSSSDARIYANEGCVQLLFFKGDPCATSYADRDGKYQDQGPQVTTSKV